MSGDNLHGNQPLKFYSKEITKTKIIILEDYFKKNYQSEKMSDLDEKHKEWEKALIRWIDN